MLSSADLSVSAHSDAVEPESADILRLTRLTAAIFRVPISYMALFGPNLQVVTRVGDGIERCRSLRETWPVSPATAWPILWPSPDDPDSAGFAGDGLQLVCSAPLCSSEGLAFGLLIVADTEARPDFTARERDVLAELAGVFGRQMELCGIASDARAAELSMREAEARFRNIANCAPVLIFCADSSAGCSFVNDTWLEFTGRTLEDEMGEGFAETFHPDYRETVLRSYRDAFIARQPSSIEFPMLRRDGVYRWMHASGKPRFLEDGTFAGYMGCFVDITDQRAAALEAEKYRAVAAAVAEAGGVTWELLDPAGDDCRTYSGDWTCTPVLAGGELAGIVATRR